MAEKDQYVGWKKNMRGGSFAPARSCTATTPGSLDSLQRGGNSAEAWGWGKSTLAARLIARRCLKFFFVCAWLGGVV